MHRSIESCGVEHHFARWGPEELSAAKKQNMDIRV